MKIHGSAFAILLIIAVSIFVVEFLVMVVLYTANHEIVFAYALLDSVLLVTLLSPFLYLFLFRPVLRNIKERMRVEADLTRERDRAHGYLDVAGVLLMVLDTEGKVLLINKRGCDILGCSESEIIGKDWFKDFMPRRARQKARQAFLRLLSHNIGAREVFEVPVLTRSGGERTLIWHNRVVYEAGRLIGTLNSGEDITERKEAEEALRERETRYRLINDTSFDAIIIADSEDRIIECNPSAERMFGYGPGEMLGVRIAEIMPERYRRRHHEGLRHFLETGLSGIQGRVLDIEGLKRDGEVFPTELVLSSFSIGEKMYFSATIRDVTEKKRAEDEKVHIQAQLNQVQKMEAIGTLAGGLAHDFNNMLTAMRGNAELALEDVAPGDPVRTRLNEIIQSVAHASKLTRQLMLFSRRQPTRLLPLDLNRAIDSILPIICRIIGDNITVVTELSDDIWTVRADESNIEQVFLNLAVNARDAMPDGGRITVRTLNVTFTEDDVRGTAGARPGNAACFSVEDTGAGIAGDVIQHIFEPFFSTKEPGKGTGLGLAVVYGIVSGHKGWVTVDSGPGLGARFMVCLPAATEDAAGEGEAPGLTPDDGSKPRHPL